MGLKKMERKVEGWPLLLGSRYTMLLRLLLDQRRNERSLRKQKIYSSPHNWNDNSRITRNRRLQLLLSRRVTSPRTPSTYLNFRNRNKLKPHNSTLQLHREMT